MARRPSAPPPLSTPVLGADERRHAIERLNRRITELQAFEPMGLQARRSPEVVQLETAIEETLRAVFGNATSRYRLYQSAADLEPAAVLKVTPPWIAARGGGMGGRENLYEYRMQVVERKQRAIVLLGQAIQGLEEEFVPELELPAAPIVPATPSNRLSASNSIADAEIRGRLLTTFYERRHNAEGWVPTSDINLSPDPVDRQVIGGVCQHLADVGLIQWKPLRGASEGFVIGMAKITGKGVAAVEAGWCAEIDIRFPSGNAPTAGPPSMSVEHGVRAPPAAQIATGSEEPLPDAALREIRDAITEIRGQLPAIIASNSIKADVEADIVQINTELDRPTPRGKFIKTFLESLRDNLAKAAAAGMVAAVVGILAKFFHVF